MSNYILPVPPPTLLPVSAGGLFPVRRVYCVGRNYAEHAREMGHDPEREPPFFFQKNPDDLNTSGEFPYPPQSRDVHYEAELAVALKSGGTDIAPKDALSCVFGYAAALDMTRRDLQAEAKAAGRPWEIGKAFHASGPIGPLHRVDDTGDLQAGAITLTLNGDIRQNGDLAQMIWSVPEIIACLSQTFTLAAGDVILTGTPAGVGPVSRGDRLRVEIDGLTPLAVTVI